MVNGKMRKFCIKLLDTDTGTTVVAIRDAYLNEHPGVKSPGVPTALTSLLRDGLVRSEPGTGLTSPGVGRPADRWFLTDAGKKMLQTS